jgi:hypothetical protein
MGQKLHSHFLRRKMTIKKKIPLAAHEPQTAEQITEQLVAMQSHVRRKVPRVRNAKTLHSALPTARALLQLVNMKMVHQLNCSFE